MINNEIWKPVVGYEGLYEVSNYGKIKSLKRYVRSSNTDHKTINEILMKEFPSIADAEKETGISHSNIGNCCHKKYGFKTAGGYRWELF